MDSPHLLSLAERVEAASGPDRELDALIYHDVLGFCPHANTERNGAQSDTGYDCLDCGADTWGNKSRKGGYREGQGYYDRAPHFTASIDAAMTLVDAEWFWRVGHDGEGADPSMFRADIGEPISFGFVKAIAATPALAICAAALKARASQSHSQTERGEA